MSSDRTITVLSPGPLSTVQDLGRPGLAYLGVGRSGAADRRSHSRANRIVGNDDGAATIEMTLGRLRARFDGDAVIALTGATGDITIDGRPGRSDTALTVAAGQQLRVGPPPTGLRGYLAVAGGIDVPAVLGSRSTDMLSGIGPERLRPGAVLPLGEPLHEPLAGPAGLLLAPNSLRPVTAQPALGVIPGPRADWFTSAALDTLCCATWSVTTDANRVGIRLAGPMLDRRIAGELQSEPMVEGALQVPPNGQPIMFLADHPVTGGYPVLAVVCSADLQLAAQLRPGQQIRFGRHPGPYGAVS